MLNSMHTFYLINLKNVTICPLYNYYIFYLLIFIYNKYNWYIKFYGNILLYSRYLLLVDIVD